MIPSGKSERSYFVQQPESYIPNIPLELLQKCAGSLCENRIPLPDEIADCLHARFKRAETKPAVTADID